jgi:uncharacterized OsmC-like protein
MRSDLCVRAVHVRDMRVDVHVREHVLATDYPAVAGNCPTPLEVQLASLAACAANTLNLVLSRKMNIKVDSLEVEAAAERRTEHPTVLTHIQLVYHVRGHALDPSMLEGAKRIAEDQLCPVLAMLRPGVSVQSTLVAEEASVHS